MRFQPIRIYRRHRFSLLRDTLTGLAVCAILRPRGAADYEQHYRISEEELDEFLADEQAASAFADRAEGRQLEERLVDWRTAAINGTERGGESGSPVAAGGRFDLLYVSRSGRYALERDRMTGRPVFSIPVTNGLTDYTEWYAISEAEFDLLVADREAAKAFAARCGRRELDDRLVLEPGSDRGVYE